LVPPIEHLHSTRYWGATSKPSRQRPEQPPSIDHYLSPVPRAPDRGAISPGENAGAVEIFSKPPSLSFWNAPVSNSDDQQWTSSGASPDRSAPEVVSDATPDNYWAPGANYAGVGHHHVPRAVYEKFAFPKETRKVFEKATTGPLPFYRWHENDELHRLYSAAVKELITSIMQEHDISAQQMTPDHAHAVLKAIAISEDPRITIYRAMLLHMRRLFRLRTGVRGSE
jgi:hypothetical protein